MLVKAGLQRWLRIISAQQHCETFNWSTQKKERAWVQARPHLLGPGRLVVGVDHVFVMVQLLLLGLPGLLLLLLQRHQVGPLLLQLPLQPLRLTLLLDLLTLVLLRWGVGAETEERTVPGVRVEDSHRQIGSDR